MLVTGPRLGGKQSCHGGCGSSPLKARWASDVAQAFTGVRSGGMVRTEGHTGGGMAQGAFGSGLRLQERLLSVTASLCRGNGRSLIVEAARRGMESGWLSRRCTRETSVCPGCALEGYRFVSNRGWEKGQTRSYQGLSGRSLEFKILSRHVTWITSD
jgi:hypothetical protein